MTPGKCQPFAGNAGDFLFFHSFRRHRPQRGKHRFCLRFPPLPLPGISSRFKHSPDFSGIQSESVPALRPTARPHIRRRHACPRPYRSALSPSPLFPQKAAHRLPRQSARKRFSARLPVLPAFISQNLRIILAHNHRRRCGNDFIADARSARFPQIFCQIFNR